MKAPARPLVMAILNMTPDSFYDGGRFDAEGDARARVERLVSEGADIIDVGAESTRPGASPVSDAEQLRRIGRIVSFIVTRGVRASIDTTSSVVARAALDEGATLVNSVSLEVAPELASLATASGADLILMHSRGAMASMAGFSHYPEAAYGDVVADVRSEWLRAADRALARGLSRERLYFDPGIGFQKSARQSVELLARLDAFVDMGFPIAVGASRKSFIAKISREDGAAEPAPDDRLGGSIAAGLAAADRGASLVRVHDPGPMRQALAVRAAIASSSVSEGEARPPAKIERGAA